ncbi:MAG: hypothetical protein IJD45_02610 [Clostridia bacterium]|nr:hypothetical protein [Clostridia bacterium]
MNLLSKPFTENGNYLCTWDLQEKIALKLNIEGENIPVKQRNCLTDNMLFGENSLFHVVPKEYLGGIYFLIDDGWDVPFGTNTNISKAPFGSLILDDKKFEGYGDTPTERLKTLNQKVKAMGYCGLGLWVSPQIPFENQKTTMADHRKHWCERAKWSNDAGVKYWKIDWGEHAFRRDYLEMMTQCIRENAPDLLIEHAVVHTPFGGPKTPEDDVAKKMANIMEVSDFFRTYDVCEPFSNTITLCRTNALLCNVQKDNFLYNAKGYVNIESSPEIAAGLGLNMGIMAYNGNVGACLNWQRLAPPMSIFDADYIKSDELLTDSAFFETSPVWWYNAKGQEISSTVPAITARGTKLPKVEADSLKPFVMASCNNKTKAYAVSTLKRCFDMNKSVVAPAKITVFPENLTAPIGVFGYYKTLCIEFEKAIPKNAKIYAQCLLETQAKDVTENVTIDGNKLIIDGKNLRLWGRKSDAIGDSEDPALILQIII